MNLQVQRHEKQGDIDLTPMIDVVFLLVIFFMVTTTFIEEAKVYKITLPRAEKPQTISRENATMLTVTFDGKIYLQLSGGKEEELSGFKEAVDKLKTWREKAAPSDPVILRCDVRSEYQQCLQAKNAIRLAGVDFLFEEVQVHVTK